MATSTMPQRHGRPKRVGHDDRRRRRRNGLAPRRGSGAADASGSRGRSVTIEPDSGPDVRRVDAAVGADEAVRRLGDEDAVLHADDPSGLAEDDLDLAGIAVEALGELDGLRPGVDAGQVDDGALGLRDDLLGHDEHVVLGERQRARRRARGRRR